MKLHLEQDTGIQESVGTIRESGFRIKTSPVAFRILSSGLYSDKIGAVLREIGCNAADAHIEAGIPDVPFEVKLPNALDPIFYIRDHGLGLDEDGVMGLYTTYFSSTKSDSDSFTGAFGLGSKSPFSYTDSFTVTAVKDGVKRIFMASISTAGTPSIELKSITAADEDWKHGLEISLPVRKSDFNEFEHKAVSIYAWFKVKPKVLGTANAMVLPAYKYQQPTFRLSPEQPYTAPPASVLMGNVLYPIDYSELQDTARLYGAVVSHKVILSMPIGSVMVTASREGLDYTEETRAALRLELSKVIKFLASALEAEWQKPHANEWARLSAIAAIGNAMDHALTEIVKKQFWEISTLPDLAKKAIVSVLDNVAITLPSWLGSEKDDSLGFPSGCNVMVYRLSSDSKKSISRRSVKAGQFATRTGGEAAKILVGAETTIMIADAKHTAERAKKALLEKQFSQILVISNGNSTKPAAIKQVTEYAEKVSTAVHGLPISMASGIDIGPIQKSAKATATVVFNTNAKTKVRYCDMTSAGDPNPRADAATELGTIPSEGMYYVTLTSRRYWSMRFSMTIKGVAKELDFEDFKTILTQMKHGRNALPGFDFKGVAILSKGDIRTYRLGANGWKDFGEVVEQFTGQIPKVVEALNVSAQAALPEVRHNGVYQAKYNGLLGMMLFYANQGSQNQQKVLKGILAKYPTSVLSKYVEMYQKYVRNSKTEEKLQTIRRFTEVVKNLGLEIKVDMATSVATINPVDEVAEAFPCLVVMDWDKYDALVKSNPTDGLLVLTHMMKVEAGQ